MSKNYLVLALTCFIPLIHTWGMNTLSLEDGKSLQGEIVDSSGQFITINTDGNSVQILKSLIVNISDNSQTDNYPAGDSTSESPETVENEVPLLQYSTPEQSPSIVKTEIAPAQIQKEDSVQNTSDSGIIFISVLPLQGDSSLKELLPVFTDIFRKELAETGKFKVMAREMMKQIIEEREFQLSDMCDESTCMAAAGKIFGVSQIASGSIVVPEKNACAVTVKLIDVATGNITGQESEKLEGDIYAVTKLMLKNLASVLAGKPCAAHEEITRRMEKEGDALTLQQKVASNRFRIGISADALYPLHLFQERSYLPARQSLQEDTANEILDKASDKFCLGFTINGDYRVNKVLSTGFTLGWNRADLRRNFAKRSHNYYLDTILGLDTLVMDGPVSYYTSTNIEYSMFTAGINIGIKIVNSPRVAVNVNLNPQWGYINYNLVEHDSSLWDLPTYINSGYIGQTQQYDEIIRNAKLKGNAFGGGLGAAVSFFPFSNLEFSTSVGLRTLVTPSLEGKEQIDSVIIIRDNNGNTEKTRGSRSQKAAIMKGDFLGTGEFLTIEDPTRKSPSGVTSQKAWMEFSSLRISLAITFIF